MVCNKFFWPYSMFSSVLPLVQMAQVTLGHPKNVNKEERKKVYGNRKTVWYKVSLSFLLISGSHSLSNHNKQKRDGLHTDDHTFAPTVPGTPGTPSFPAGPWTETGGREMKQ